ncbi:MAG: hypothetical protein WA939_07325, partial [Nodosilinea sp.]
VYSNIVLALISNAIFSGLGFVFAKAFDRFPGKAQNTKNQLLEKFRREAFELLEENISTFLPKEKSNSVYLPTIKPESEINSSINFLYSYWEGKLIKEPMNSWSKSLQPDFQQLVEINSKYHIIRKKLIRISENFSEKISCYFSDVATNLEKLRDNSKTLKRKSVDPSFELLASTRDVLQNLKEKIDEVDF